jgi:hypothetical protein
MENLENHDICMATLVRIHTDVWTVGDGTAPGDVGINITATCVWSVL